MRLAAFVGRFNKNKQNLKHYANNTHNEPESL